MNAEPGGGTASGSVRWALQRAAPIAITGAGCLCAAGGALADVMASLYRGERAPRPPSRLATNHKVRFPVFEVPDACLSAEVLRAPGFLRCSHYAACAAGEALQDAGLDPAALRGRRVGVCLGTTVGSALNTEDFHVDYRAGRCPDPAGVRGFLDADPSGVVMRRFDLAGPRQTVTNACSSGSVAIGEAAAWIAAGLCDVAVAGGAEMITRVSYDGFAALLISDPEPCRPFDRSRRGLNLGEGAGVLVLESDASAAARGARVRGRLLGYGNASDAYHLSAPRPDGAALRKAIADALAAGGRDAAAVAFINAHGTGTAENDRVEGQVFAAALPGVPYVSTKGYTGHALGAAGGLEAAITLACLEHGRVPANAGFREPDPDIPAAPVSANTDVRGDCALSVSVSFGGNNAALLIGNA